jgi:hypothetical protein
LINFEQALQNIHEEDKILHNNPESPDNLYTPAEIVEIVTMIRLGLYNEGKHCGAQTIRLLMEKEAVKPLPSVRTISRILSSQGLTHRRTGKYDDDS